ncbi:S-layer homology domain-containing protein [Cohnella zeiphila]|uniref:S-layer homology domain-containing protein n=1 Tax=Cohnella zeiphila TaxID=2761120 RepID=A0A7X0SHE7_9BACL|nr:S-layer homology domain-containing protein [Cohnella zeiphila]MBB6729992.1 S-layer homology domain-containing protein [Cohnella zeiphila]
MRKLKTWLAGLAAAMLLFSAAPVYADETQPADQGTGPAVAEAAADAAPSYVRIKNRWQSNYLYEASDHRVLYGRTAPEDASSHWIVEDGENGAKRIKNVKTGDYITLDGVAQRRDALMAQPAETSSPQDQWYIENAVNEGFVLIKSAAVPSSANLVVHEEDQLGYAEVSNDINVTFDSPQWALEPEGTASEIAPVRIVNFTTGAAGTDYLYEDASTGEIKHGDLSAADSDHLLWRLEDYDGKKRIRNVATGHYATAGDPALGTAGTSDAAKDDQWTIVESEQYDDYVALQSVSDSTRYLNIGGEDGLARSGSVDPNSDAAQWMLEDPAAAAQPEYVRIKNEWQSFVLYEDENGDLKYGNERTDGRDQWHIVKYDGRKLFVNRATGHYLSMPGTDGRLKVVAHDPAAAPAPELIWSVKSMGGASKIIRNVGDPLPAGDNARLINLQNLTKYAEYSIINRNWGSPKWDFIPVTDSGPATVRFVSADGSALYEKATDNPDVGIVQYGGVPASDRTSLWLLAATPDGAYWVQNVATGHHLSLQNIADNPAAADDPMQATKEFYEVWGSAKWKVEGTLDTPGFLRSAWSGHVARMDGSGNVKASDTEDDSGKFTVVPAVVAPPLPEGPIRIRNNFNGQYLFEQNGIVKYGDVAESNGYSHWIVEQDGDTVRLKNRATGDYAQTSPDYSYIVASAGGGDSDAAGWSLEPTADGNHWLLRSRNGSYSDEYLNVQNGLGYAERGLYLTSFGSLQWDFAAAPEAFETPDMNGERNEITSTPVQDDTNYVRIASSSDDGTAVKYLTEDGGGVSLAASVGGAASQWLAQDFNGRKLLRNRATGHLLAADGSALQTVSEDSRADASAQWMIEDSLGYKVVRSASSEALPLLAAAGGGVGLDAAASVAGARWAFEPVVSDVVYEAEDAFQGGGATAAADVPGYTGTGYVTDMGEKGAKISFAVNAQAEGSYQTSVRYLNTGGAARTVGVYVNGIRTQALNLPGTSGWSELAIGLDLRAGINSVALQADDAGQTGAAIDSLTVRDSVNKAYRGATVPYVSYEAEQGTTNGDILGPTRTYLDVASEASGREAVQLSETGQYVEFKTVRDADSIVLRYSIPDSPDGKGTTATLGLYVDGKFRQKLELSSKYAWEYGSYPWSNNPQDGNPHRFFDEMHALTGDIPAGSTVRLEKDEDSTADHYVIDLVEMEQVAEPYAMPDGFLSVTDYGAVANDGQDDTAAFKAAMEAAKEEGKGVWFPQGEFGLADGLLDLDQVTIRGAGMWYTTLKGAKFFGRGVDIQVYDLMIDGEINVRDDEAHTNAFEGAFGPGSVIQDVWIEHTKAGLWLTKPKDGAENEITDGLYMLGLRIRDLMADGINFCVGTENSMMEQTDVRYPGDDGIAIWSAEGRASVNNTVRFNTVSLPWLADNYAVFGGTGNKFQDNIGVDSIRGGAGIAVSTRFSPVPFAGTTVVERNTFIRTGSYSPDVQSNLGAIWVAAQEKDMNTGRVVIRDNTALNSMYQGLSILGTFNMGQVVLQDLVFDGAGTNGVEVAPTLKGGAQVDNVIVRNAKMADVANGAGNAFVFDEVNEGFANAVKPFSAEWTDGSTGRFVLGQGRSASSKVKDPSGADIGDKASFTTADTAIATVTADGVVTGISDGETRLHIAVGDASRDYTLTVIPSAPTSVPSNPGSGTAGSSGSAADNDRKLADSKESAIVFEVRSDNADGKVPFTVAGLQKALTVHPNATLVIRNGGASYWFPLSLIGKLLDGRDVSDPASAIWTFTVRPSAVDEAAQAAEQAKKQGFSLAGNPVEFAVSLQAGDRNEPIGYFGGVYVNRTIEVNGELNPDTATALVYDPASGSFEYVPATFSTSGGKTTATIRSMGNSIYVVADHPATFADIASHWAQDAIEKLAAKTIVQGVSAGEFAPNRAVTRAEFAALLVRALGLRGEGVDNGVGKRFSDVGAEAWYAKDVAIASAYGLAQGMADGTFRPGDTITREQMAVMIAQAWKLAAAEDSASESSASAAGTGSGFRDAADIHAWAADAVAAAVSKGLMQGKPGGVFAPLDPASRAEAATLLGRLLTAAGLMN